MPYGLYRDVVSHKYRYFFLFHVACFFQWMLLLLQVLLGAALTALGSMSLEDGKPITILGAANTVIAGVLALFHNSGIPNRYWNNMAEFEDIEDHIKEMLDSGIVPTGQSAPQALAECFDYFRDAKVSIVVNLSANYSSRQPPRATKPRNTTMPPPAGQPGSSAAPNAEGPA